MVSHSVKLGLYLPAPQHARMVEAVLGAGRGALQAAYSQAFIDLLDALDAGLEQTFVVVRGPKRRVTVRLPSALCERIRSALTQRSLKITDFACAAIDRHLPPTPGA